MFSDSVISCWCFGLTMARAHGLSFNAHIGGVFKVGTSGGGVCCSHGLFFFFLNWSIDFYLILFSFDCDSNKGNSLQIKLCHLERGVVAP